jgi:hypothetical protein
MHSILFRSHHFWLMQSNLSHPFCWPIQPTKSNVVGGDFLAGADWENRPLALDGGRKCDWVKSNWDFKYLLSKCSDRGWMLFGRIGLMFKGLTCDHK